MPELEALLQSLSEYTDDALWRIVEYRISEINQNRRRKLVEKSPLLEQEQSELEVLVEEYDRFVAVRSEALLLLKQRGFDMVSYLKK